MDERRGDPPEQVPQPGHIAADGPLSRVQQAQRRRAAHAQICRQCADVDRDRCTEGEQLWRDWTAALDDAYRRLHGGR